MERLGAVIVFKPHIDKAEAEAILEQLCIEQNIIEGSRVNKYDDEYGGPVWYIP